MHNKNEKKESAVTLVKQFEPGSESLHKEVKPYKVKIEPYNPDGYK